MNDRAKETGRRLKSEREAKGMSQSQLAAYTGWRRGSKKGLSPAAIGNYEQGSRRIRAEPAAILENVFGLPAAYFTGEISREEAEVLAALRSRRSTM